MITQVATGIPPAFDAVLARALARDPDERYASAGELGRAAQAAAGGPPRSRRGGRSGSARSSPTA